MTTATSRGMMRLKILTHKKRKTSTIRARVGSFPTSQNLMITRCRIPFSFQRRALDCAKVCFNGLSKSKKPFDYDAIRPLLGWKPIEVVKHTLAATTQYAMNVMRLSMRRHFKSRFPALRVRRLEDTLCERGGTR
jgi:hypothetical protein